MGFEEGGAIDVDDEAVEEEEGEERETEAGPEDGIGGPAVIGSTLGRKVELMSPMPTKKSSALTVRSQHQD